MKEKENLTLSAEEIEGMQAELADLKRKLDLGEKVKELEVSLSEKEEALKEKEEAISAKDEELNQKEEAHKAEIEQLNAELSTAKEEKEALLKFLQDEVKKVAMAAGKKEVEVPSDLGGISAMLNENQQLLATLVPAGGVSRSVNYHEEENKFDSVKIKSYQVRR